MHSSRQYLQRLEAEINASYRSAAASGAGRKSGDREGPKAERFTFNTRRSDTIRPKVAAKAPETTESK